MCGWGKKGQSNQSLGRSRGGFSTKIHALVDGLGNPLKIILTPGQKSDIGQAKPLLSGYELQQVIGDKGYDSDDLVNYIEENGGIAVIPPRSNRLEKRDYDPHIYKERHLVECFFNKLKYYRRVFSRFEKTDECYLGFVSFASVLIWLR